MSRSFLDVLDQIRSMAESEFHKGRLFERLMKTYFREDPIYADRFSNVWLWSEWSRRMPGFGGADLGIDLVAEERTGGYCAIQCKCYSPKTRISKPHLDSFISASAREPFTTRIVVDTGDAWGPNAVKTVKGLTPPCTVLRFGGLFDSPFDWPDLAEQEPEDLSFRQTRFELRPHQREAFHDVITGLETSDRGKLIMACGTGKTFVALRIAEHVARVGGRSLYLVPSISLLAQAMREWAFQQGIPHRYIGICSDTSAGRRTEDASFEELEIPVTTDPEAIADALREPADDFMTVVFCTYHSLPIVEAAQDDGAPSFDLALCDEAHRTTGIEREEGGTSPFVLIHDAERIRSRKRLYLTATPRLYTEGAKAKAARHDVEVFSMDDPARYGPEFHRLPFSEAVEKDLLSDYRVVILTLREDAADPALQQHLADSHSEINISDAAKMVGCWRALQDPENRKGGGHGALKLRRAIAFTNTIPSSRRLANHWAEVVEGALRAAPDGGGPPFRCEVQHVDGKHHAIERRARLEWLRGRSDDACRVLSNARCLTEGIDVPALDAVLFMSPRNSHVDIVQAVGRAMRKAPGKTYGYIVLPVAIPSGVEPAAALNDNERFAAVWGVLRALRSHDDRLDAEINRMDLNRNPSERIIFSNGREPGEGNGDEEPSAQPTLPFPPLDVPAGAIYTRIVEKCGDRKYWETWAKDVADIFERLVVRIGSLLEGEGNETLVEWFDAFHAELKGSINDSIRREHAVEMMAQHILTRPVFEALFEGYDFAAGNPVARALDGLRSDFGEFGLENEVRDLEKFYASVRMRAAGLDNAEARQRVLMELYEKFFATALKKEADRLGIVYTPVEVVDFILKSADHALRDEFGRSLSDLGIHVLDPFAGTGIFLARLLQSPELIPDTVLERKYGAELWANEIVLLAYYIAAVSIEEAFGGRSAATGRYEPFRGIALTDTFNLLSRRDRLPGMWLPDNSERVARQQAAPIQVIVGNPPWSAWQRSSRDDNPNVSYPRLERRVAETYAVRSKATLKNSLYDTYKMAIRWASDRLGERGVIALVTNGSWIDGNVDSGIRACLAEEFTTVYVLNLRGNQRTQGERSRQEGGKVFGQGSRAPVAITILVRNPQAEHQRCRILYRDIGDYRTREEKLAILREAGSIAGFDDWTLITPNRHYDWIAQRSEAFAGLMPVGSKAAKAGKSDEAIFTLFSNGFKTGRDAWVYNFSREKCAGNARHMVEAYLEASKELETRRSRRGQYDRTDDAPYMFARDVDEVTSHYSSTIRWDRELKRRLRQAVPTSWSDDHVRQVAQRPFVKQYLYADRVFSQAPGHTGALFNSKGQNRAICVTGVGSTRPFSALVVDTMPDLELISKGQCFPRYRFERSGAASGSALFANISSEQVDNIPAAAVRRFHLHYRDPDITGDDIFHYVYGVLHSPAYRKRFANDLARELPRIPLAPDFRAFSAAGRELATLHLGYETCPEFPLTATSTGPERLTIDHFRLGTRAMRFADEGRTQLILNEFVRLGGIPSAAHDYDVNGRTPLGWFMDRYRVTKDRESGIPNNPNDWFSDPREIVPAIRRIVHVSAETVRIVNSLPDPFPRQDTLP